MTTPSVEVHVSDADVPAQQESMPTAPPGEMAESGTADAATAVSDRRLLQRFALQSDETGFTALMDRHQTGLLRLASALLGNRDAAQDAVQEAFLRLGREAPTLLRRWPEGGAGLGGWLATVVRNWCIDQLRRRRSVTMDAGDEPVATQPTPAAHVATAEVGQALWEAVAALPPLERAAVVLRYRDGLAYQDIAVQIGKTATHVGVLLHQAMGRLRQVSALRGEVV